MYSVEFSLSAEKEFHKLEKEIQVRIIASLERCRIRPYAYIKNLVGNPYFSLRVGDYRLIVDIQQNQFIIIVIEIGHRKNIYG